MKLAPIASSRIASALILALATAPLMAPATARAANLVVCTEGSPDTLNAATSSLNIAFDVAQQYADTLVDIAPGTSTLRPSLALSWAASPDGKTYTFKLRPGVKFQPSPLFKPTRAMNADDVLFSFTRMLDPASPYNQVGGGKYPMFESFLRDKLKSVRKLDDLTVAFELTAPSASFVSILSVQSFSIGSAEYAGQRLAAGDPQDIDLKPIGTGPFQLTDYRPDSLVRFRAFPDYWGAGTDRAAKVDGLIFAITPDATVRVAKLRTDECQIARYPNISELAAIRATPGISLVQVGIPLINYIGLRTDKKPFDDLRVRQALAMALDLDGIVKIVFQGNGTPAAALIPPVLWGHDASLKPRPQDLDQARALLKQAGYADGFETDMWAVPVGRSYMPDGRRAAALVQSDWARIGVKVNIVNIEYAEFLRRIRQNEGSVVILGQTWDYPDPAENLAIFTCASPSLAEHVVHWCNKAYDDAFNAADRTDDQARRSALYQTAQQVFYHDIPAIQLADTPSFAAIRNGVTGFHLHPFGGQAYAGVTLAP